MFNLLYVLLWKLENTLEHSVNLFSICETNSVANFGCFIAMLSFGNQKYKTFYLKVGKTDQIIFPLVKLALFWTYHFLVENTDAEKRQNWNCKTTSRNCLSFERFSFLFCLEKVLLLLHFSWIANVSKKSRKENPLTRPRKNGCCLKSPWFQMKISRVLILLLASFQLPFFTKNAFFWPKQTNGLKMGQNL